MYEQVFFYTRYLCLKSLRENNGNKVWLFIQIGFFAELGV
jgi:hypothetical protein